MPVEYVFGDCKVRDASGLNADEFMVGNAR
jgi:hypothetical protein